MRDKHIQVPHDSSLLKLIYKKVDEELIINSNRTNLMLGLKFAFYFSAAILLYASLYQIENTALFICCFVLYGFMSLLFAFNFAHDLSHNTVFTSKRLNNLGFISIYTIVGAHAEAWKLRHVHSHHYAPNVEDYDSDMKITNLIRVIPDSDHVWYHRFQHWYAPIAYTSYSLFWVFIKDFVILFSEDEFKAKKGIRYHLSFWAQKALYVFYLLVLPLMFAQQQWHTVLIAFIAMHLLQSMFLLFTFFITHHVEATHYPTTDENGYIKSSWLMNQIKSSNDFYPFSTVVNFIFGGFNNHIAHHLFPHVHHIHYPALNKVLYNTLHEHNIAPNRTGYLSGIVSHLRLLKKMSTKNS